MTRLLRGSLLALGLALGLYGGYLLYSRTQDDHRLIDAGIWLASGVVLHDFVLSPIVLLLVAAAERLLPRVAHAPAVVGLVVLGTATMFAVPVLSGNGERSDNPTLDDRNYTGGWLALAGVVLLVVIVVTLYRHRRRAGRAADG